MLNWIKSRKLASLATIVCVFVLTLWCESACVCVFSWALCTHNKPLPLQVYACLSCDPPWFFVRCLSWLVSFITVCLCICLYTVILSNFYFFYSTFGVFFSLLLLSFFFFKICFILFGSGDFRVFAHTEFTFTLFIFDMRLCVCAQKYIRKTALMKCL